MRRSGTCSRRLATNRNGGVIYIEELSKRKLVAMDLKFEEYQSVNEELTKREYELRYPWKETDTNVGGGRATMRADGTERTLEVIEHDPRMIQLRQLKKAGDAVLSQMRADEYEVYRIRYCSIVNYRWSDLESFLPYSHSAIYRYRYGILSALAKELGELT